MAGAAPPAIVLAVEVTLTEPGTSVVRTARAPLEARWLGRIGYREAHAIQKRLVDQRAARLIGDQLLLLEHPAVLTLGRHSDPAHILATADELAALGIGIEHIERGGEVTYHGPGQLVAYPIVALHERGLLIRPLVRALETALVETCAALGVTAGRRDGHPGCWCDADGPAPRKIGALGLRVERGVSYHGVALNVTVDLADFELIDACGMPGVESTSIARELGDLDARPTTASVEPAAWAFAGSFAAAIDASLHVAT
jgi:lipoyl(octanoyl) transferase